MKYRVCIQLLAEKFVAIEADSPEEAVDIAVGLTGVALCHYCSRIVNITDATGYSVLDESGELVYEE